MEAPKHIPLARQLSNTKTHSAVEFDANGSWRNQLISFSFFAKGYHFPHPTISYDGSGKQTLSYVCICLAHLRDFKPPKNTNPRQDFRIRSPPTQSQLSEKNVFFTHRQATVRDLAYYRPLRVRVGIKKHYSYRHALASWKLG